MTLKSKNNERGFTIVELLIVIIVIGILATLVLIAYGNVQGQARDTKRQSNAQSTANAAEQFKTASLSGAYPRMDTGANFQTDMTNTALYSNGVAPVAVDQTVTTGLGQTPSGTSTATTYNINVTWCGPVTSPVTTYTNTNASGVKLGYWSEASKVIKYVSTGTNC